VVEAVLVEVQAAQAEVLVVQAEAPAGRVEVLVVQVDQAVVLQSSSSVDNRKVDDSRGTHARGGSNSTPFFFKMKNQVF